MTSKHAGRDAASLAGRRPRPAARHARRRSLIPRFLGLSTLSIALFGGTGVGLAYADIQSNIASADISTFLDREEDATPVDPAAGRPLNFLILGTDARIGDSDIDGAGAAGEVAGMRSDTTMVVHISADRSRIEIVSIPRDTLIDVPPCKLTDGSWTNGYHGMFNSAFSTGGDDGNVAAAAACTIRTVEKMSGLTIDDFVVIDFAGFINVVDALDGIALYVPEPVNDRRYTHLKLDKGCHVMDGETALAYARVRHGVGDGGDISRISRQQIVVNAVIAEVLSRNLLTDLPALYAFLDAGTQSLTTGTNLNSLTMLGGLANSLRGISGDSVEFITMPHAPEGPRVVPVPETRDLWLRLQRDQPATVEPAVSEEPDTGTPTSEADAKNSAAQDAPNSTAGAAGSAEEEAPPAIPVCRK